MMSSQLYNAWMAQAGAYWEELAPSVAERLQDSGKVTIRLSMTIDGQRVKFAATVGKAAVRGTPHEESLDDPSQEKLEGLE